MRRSRLALVTLVATLLTTSGVGAYLKLGLDFNGRTVGVRWSQMPIRYFVTNRDTSGVTAPQLQIAVQQGLDTWAKVPTVSVSSQFVGFTSAEPSADDGMSVIGFSSRPDLDRTLGATMFQLDAVTGEVIESDIFLNSAFDWSVAARGETGRYDVQSIVTHELGHFLGLGHSALGETEIQPSGGRRVISKLTVMFPIAFPAGNVDDRALKPDDVAGMGDVFASAAFRAQSGQAIGRVTLNGQGVFGAHVTAFNPATGDLVGGFCLDAQGNFVVGGLKPGLYLLRAEPLDDADLSAFFGSAVVVNIDFKPAYASRLVAVPAGGSSVAVEIKVPSK
jgi:hypothetical protein